MFVSRISLVGKKNKKRVTALILKPTYDLWPKYDISHMVWFGHITAIPIPSIISITDAYPSMNAQSQLNPSLP